MNPRRAVQQERAGNALPDVDGELQCGLGHINREKAERVVDEMKRDVREQNEAGRESDVAPGEMKAARDGGMRGRVHEHGGTGEG